MDLVPPGVLTSLASAMAPGCLHVWPQGLQLCVHSIILSLVCWMLCGFERRSARARMLASDSCMLCPMAAFDFDGALLATGAK